MRLSAGYFAIAPSSRGLCTLAALGAKEWCSISYDSIETLVVGLHLPWAGVWQRPNHLLSRAALDVPIVILQEPVSSAYDDDEVTQAGDLTLIAPRRAAPALDALDASSIAAVRRAVGGRRPLVWLYTPMMLALADAFPDAPLVFDKMDELAAFAHADPRLAAREDALLARADVVFTGGRSLQRSVSGRTRFARCYPSGVDVEHFARARTIAPHAELRNAGRGPVFAYVGVIDERIDLALVAAVADAFPAAIVAMIGPVVKIDPASLPHRPNIVYLGRRDYDELPALLAASDVALMPFALNGHTANISPTKTLEYLAAGLPVVSTAVPDVVADHAATVHIADDAATFVALIARARVYDPVREAAARASVAAAGWDAIWSSMLGDLRSAGVSYPERASVF